MIRALSAGSPEMPHLLASIPNAPRTLYVRGALPGSGCLAVVGSRRPTGYGLRMARALAADAARAGVPTVSGLARGIDTEVHRATLDAGGLTWAVLGSGLDRVYPPENAALAEEILAKGGGLLSEIPPDGRPLPSHFPKRNRIISGLAWGTLVVEGDAKSGSLITARAALDQGRDVLAVPGPADAPLSEGPLNLIKRGAAVVCRWQDVLDALPMLRSKAKPIGEAEEEPAPGAAERRVMDALDPGEPSLDELLERTGLPADRLALALLELEMSGRIRVCPGKRYAKK